MPLAASGSQKKLKTTIKKTDFHDFQVMAAPVFWLRDEYLVHMAYLPLWPGAVGWHLRCSLRLLRDAAVRARSAGYACAVRQILVIFFLVYTVMLTLGLLNVVTGIVVDTVVEV